MADLDAAVTDTHPLLFHITRNKRLGRHAARLFAAAERREGLIYVPAAVLWECSLLGRVGRIDLGRSLKDFCEDLFSNPAFVALDLTLEQIYLADGDRPNSDPFDALVCAAARSVGLPLITRDGDIQDSGLVKTIW